MKSSRIEGIEVLACKDSAKRVASTERICSKEDLRDKCKDGDDKGKKRSKTDKEVKLGFTGEIPSKFISEIKKEFEFKEGERIGISLTRSMLVIRIEESSVFASKLSVFDYIFALNNERVEKKTAFAEYLRKAKKSHEKFTLTVHRLIWNVHADRLPEGYDHVPGYVYILGLMVKIPGADIGMNIRSFNSKVFVANVEQMSMAATSCLVGDCIVAVDNTPVTTVATCRDKIVSGFTNNNYLVMTLERPVDKQAVRVVKFALLVEKTPQLNPRMAADTTHIGTEEAARVKAGTVVEPKKSIYKAKPHKIGLTPKASHKSSSSQRVSVNATSLFSTIMADPYNPLLMEAVPPKRMDTFYAQIKASSSATSSSISTASTRSASRSHSIRPPVSPKPGNSPRSSA